MSKFKAGDVIQYTPRDRHAREGQAVIQPNGVAFDTFWTYQPTSLWVDEIENAELLFNLGDVEPVDDISKYAREDRFYITHQHKLQVENYVRKGAVPQREVVRQNLIDAIEEAERKMEAAKSHVEWAKRDLEEFDAGRAEWMLK